jgi:threonine dehydratase
MSANGVNGYVNGHVPRTPSLSSLSLTEYSANPIPASEDKQASMKQLVPDHLLLPNGYPDVSHLFSLAAGVRIHL